MRSPQCQKSRNCSRPANVAGSQLVDQIISYLLFVSSCRGVLPNRRHHAIIRSAIAASNYVQSITEGGAAITTKIQEFSDFQQGAVQELILLHGKRLSDAENRMVELPYAIYDSQDILVREIVEKGSGGIKSGLALLGGLQINTAPDALDYFLPLRFEYMDSQGNVVDDLLSTLQ